MSQENVQVARSAIDAWNAGDIEALAELFDADAEFRPFRSQLEGTSYVGPPGVHQFARDAAEEWDFLRIDAAEYREVEDEQVLILGHMEGRGRASGMDLRVPAAWVMRFKSARLVALRAYSKYEDALEAVGLRA
jgi:ketosteroid isomerase-like protein